MEVQQNVSLKNHTTFKTGGLARLFYIVQSKEDLINAISFAKREKIDFYVLGEGSNLLVSENGFDGLVIKMNNLGVDFKEDGDHAYAHVMAGVNWDFFVQQAVGRSFYGAENLSLIPGTVGASPVQNIGAYGAEVMDVIESVEVFNTHTEKFELLSNQQCEFGYRDSIFKREVGKKYIVFSVNFLLSKKQNLKLEYKDIKEYFDDNRKEITIESVREAIIKIRRSKLPDLEKFGTAGSFFKNPLVERELVESIQKDFPLVPIYNTENSNYVKTSAAFLIDKVACMKGLRVKDVGTFENQALVITNFGSATGEEVLTFAKQIQKQVHEKTSIWLEMEVQTVGF